MLKNFYLEGLSCPTCGTKIENALKKINGINEVEVLFMSSKAKVSFDENAINQDEIAKRINRLGYKVIQIK